MKIRVYGPGCVRCKQLEAATLAALGELRLTAEVEKVEDVAAFFKLYYAPNNASLVVAGDFAPAEAKQLIAQYFGDVPRVAPPPELQAVGEQFVGVHTRYTPSAMPVAMLARVLNALLLAEQGLAVAGLDGEPELAGWADQPESVPLDVLALIEADAGVAGEEEFPF